MNKNKDSFTIFLSDLLVATLPPPPPLPAPHHTMGTELQLSPRCRACEQDTKSSQQFWCYFINTCQPLKYSAHIRPELSLAFVSSPANSHQPLCSSGFFHLLLSLSNYSIFFPLPELTHSQCPDPEETFHIILPKEFSRTQPCASARLSLITPVLTISVLKPKLCLHLSSPAAILQPLSAITGLKVPAKETHELPGRQSTMLEGHCWVTPLRGCTSVLQVHNQRATAEVYMHRNEQWRSKSEFPLHASTPQAHFQPFSVDCTAMPGEQTPVTQAPACPTPLLRPRSTCQELICWITKHASVPSVHLSH